MKTIKLTVEPSVQARLAELKTCLSLLEQTGERSVELSNIIRRLSERGADAFDFRFSGTGTADDYRIDLMPCELESELVAALAAFYQAK